MYNLYTNKDQSENLHEALKICGMEFPAQSAKDTSLGNPATFFVYIQARSDKKIFRLAIGASFAK